MTSRVSAGITGITGMISVPICVAKVDQSRGEKSAYWCRGPSQNAPGHSGNPGGAKQTGFLRQSRAALTTFCLAPKAPRANNHLTITPSHARTLGILMVTFCDRQQRHPADKDYFRGNEIHASWTRHAAPCRSPSLLMVQRKKVLK
jgi:hypothetical protein